MYGSERLINTIETVDVEESEELLLSVDDTVQVSESDRIVVSTDTEILTVQPTVNTVTNMKLTTSAVNSMLQEISSLRDELKREIGRMQTGHMHFLSDGQKMIDGQLNTFRTQIESDFVHDSALGAYAMKTNLYDLRIARDPDDPSVGTVSLKDIEDNYVELNDSSASVTDAVTLLATNTAAIASSVHETKATLNGVSAVANDTQAAFAGAGKYLMQNVTLSGADIVDGQTTILARVMSKASQMLDKYINKRTGEWVDEKVTEGDDITTVNTYTRTAVFNETTQYSDPIPLLGTFAYKEVPIYLDFLDTPQTVDAVETFQYISVDESNGYWFQTTDKAFSKFITEHAILQTNENKNVLAADHQNLVSEHQSLVNSTIDSQNSNSLIYKQNIIDTTLNEVTSGNHTVIIGLRTDIDSNVSSINLHGQNISDQQALIDQHKTLLDNIQAQIDNVVETYIDKWDPTTDATDTGKPYLRVAQERTIMIDGVGYTIYPNDKYSDPEPDPYEDDSGNENNLTRCSFYEDWVALFKHSYPKADNPDYYTTSSDIILSDAGKNFLLNIHTGDSIFNNNDTQSKRKVWKLKVSGSDDNKTYSFEDITADSGDLTALITTAQDTADSKNTVFCQSEAPTAVKGNDVWFDTNDGNKAYRWDGDNWILVRDTGIETAQTTADGKNTVFFQGSTPTSMKSGDIWFNTNNHNKAKIYKDGSWTDASDAEVSSIKLTASSAVEHLNKKVVFFNSTTDPSIDATNKISVPNTDNTGFHEITRQSYFTTDDSVGDIWYNPTTKLTKTWTSFSDWTTINIDQTARDTADESITRVENITTYIAAKAMISGKKINGKWVGDLTGINVVHVDDSGGVDTENTTTDAVVVHANNFYITKANGISAWGDIGSPMFSVTGNDIRLNADLVEITGTAVFDALNVGQQDLAALINSHGTVINGDKIDTGSITLHSSNGNAQTTVDSYGMRVYDSNNVLRVHIGDLTVT